MTERRTPDATLIEAVRILARTIQTDDGVIPACLAVVATRMAELVEERRWVPVGERLPQRRDEVLAWHWKLGVEIVERVNGNWQRNGRSTADSYTHWREMPPGPEGEKPELPTG